MDSSRRNLHLFFDFDDTISDFKRMGAQYVAALGRILSGEMGGGEDEWKNAAQNALIGSVERYLSQFQANPRAGYSAWLVQERARVVTDAFRLAGREPPDEDGAGELAILLQAKALRGCSALYPGASRALRQFSESGHSVYLASSQDSGYLRGALTGSLCFHCVQEFYGPDLVDCAKEGAEFYEAIFARVGVKPHEAVVVDDQVTCLEWAHEVGALVIQARVREASEPIGCDVYFERYEELAPLIETLAETGKLTQDLGIKE